MSRHNHAHKHETNVEHDADAKVPFYRRLSFWGFTFVRTSAVLALVFGLWGFAIYEGGGIRTFWPGYAHSFREWSREILSLLLSTLEMFEGIFIYKPDTPQKLPLPLLAGRIFALVVILHLVIRTFFSGFYIRVRLLVWCGCGKHAVVCGVGERGWHLVEELRRAGKRVVVVENDPQAPFVSKARAAGALVLIGDATSKMMLKKARVARASEVHILLPDDNLVADVALKCYELRKTRGDVSLSPVCLNAIKVEEKQRIYNNLKSEYLDARESKREKIAPKVSTMKCYLHVQQVNSREIFKRHKFLSGWDEKSGFYPQVIDENETAARRILTEYAGKMFAPFRDNPEPPHILVVGAGVLGQNLLLQMSHILHHGSRDAHGQAAHIRVSVIDKEDRQKLFNWQYPYLQEPDFDFHPNFIKGDITCLGESAWKKVVEHGNVTGVFVCLSTEIVALSSASLLQLPRYCGKGVPIVICADTGKGLAKLFESDERGKTKNKVTDISVFDFTTVPAVAFSVEEKLDRLAERLHDNYMNRKIDGFRKDAKEKAVFDGKIKERIEKLSFRTWDDLSEYYRESNRDQARAFDLKRRCIWQIEGTDGSVRVDGVNRDEDEEVRGEYLLTLAQMEHLRWMLEQYRNGCVYAEKDDDDHNHCLVSWRELPEEEKEYDIAPTQDILRALESSPDLLMRKPPKMKNPDTEEFVRTGIPDVDAYNWMKSEEGQESSKLLEADLNALKKLPEDEKREELAPKEDALPSIDNSASAPEAPSSADAGPQDAQPPAKDSGEPAA
jgi:hypothetical protein